MMTKPSIAIVTPALAAANNGNWQTASRYARFLSKEFKVKLLPQWCGESADVLIALHARRSASSIEAWAQQTGRPMIVVMTGTDLYRDIVDDASAQRSLALADRLIVLQDLGAASLPEAYREKSVVCFSSSSVWAPQAKAKTRFKALAVGHLREEKSPETFMDLAARFAGQNRFRFDHLGRALDPVLGEKAAALAAQNPAYRWLGNVPHEAVRRRIARAHVLVHPSRMEGGAHVVMEAVCSGTSVLASKVDGNVGMLGADYAGYFPLGDVDALAVLLRRCEHEPDYLAHLWAQCLQRQPLFTPSHEQATLIKAVRGVLK